MLDLLPIASRCAFWKLQRCFGFFCSVNHLSGPLRKHMFIWTSLKSHGLWFADFDQFVYNSPFYSYRWKQGCSWPCFDTNLLALLCKSGFSYAKYEFFRIISIRKGKRFVSKHGQSQPHVYSKARILSSQL